MNNVELARWLINRAVKEAGQLGLDDRTIKEILDEHVHDLHGKIWLDQHYQGDVPPRFTHSG